MNANEETSGELDGIVRNKKTYFAILAHKNEAALTEQVRNIRHFNPDSGIIIYNGGTDPEFGKSLGVLNYPDSHAIRYGNLTPYFWEVMKWLEENHVEYKYLINLDHDVLFVKHGFQDYLDKLMRDHDVIGWDMVTSSSPSDAILTCCRDMWREWDKWGPFFGTGSFIRFLNSTQVYHHDIVRRMLDTTDHQLAETLIAESGVFALEEIFFATLAFSKGARVGEYPREENWKRASRFRRQISLQEAEWVREQPSYFWIHPVKETWLILMNRWLMDQESIPPELMGDLNGEKEAAGQPELKPTTAEAADSRHEGIDDAPAPVESVIPFRSRRRKKVKAFRGSRKKSSGKPVSKQKGKKLKLRGKVLKRRTAIGKPTLLTSKLRRNGKKRRLASKAGGRPRRQSRSA